MADPKSRINLKQQALPILFKIAHSEPGAAVTCLGPFTHAERTVGAPARSAASREQGCTPKRVPDRAPAGGVIPRLRSVGGELVAAAEPSPVCLKQHPRGIASLI
jgi:hypothetical protein